VDAFFDAVGDFGDRLAAVNWAALGIALGFHFLRISARAPAWRNILRASYPGVRIPFRTVFGAYWASVGVNAIVPARGGDLLRAYLIKHRVPETTYPTIASSLVVETLLDTALGLVLLIWALQLGVLPSFASLPDINIDWSWPARHPNWFAAIAVSVFVGVVVLAVLSGRRVQSFKQRFAQGFAVLGDPGRYVRQVASWQLLSWALRIASIYFFLRAFHLDGTLRNALLVVVVQSVSTLLPFTPGGAGTQQGLLAYLFRKEEISSSGDAVAFSVGMFVATTILNAVVGFTVILLMLRTLRWRRIVKPEEASVAGGSPPAK
jgi:uncharacterized membrane protein YbhN (UPF0104 family)